MKDYNDLLERFVQQNAEILGDELVGIYLHGSAVMGCMKTMLIMSQPISYGLYQRSTR
jgi:hypothetical protein